MPTQEHRTVIGYLTQVPHAGPGETMGYFFEHQPGEYLNLKFAGGWVDSKKIPLNTKIALCMSVVEVEEFHIVCTHEPYFTEIRT